MSEQSKPVRPEVALFRKASRTMLATLLSIGALPAAAATKASFKPKEGYDVSYTQGGKAPLPKNPGFAIVGINGKYPNTFNPHFLQEWNWGKSSTHSSIYPFLSAYATIANPGDVMPKVKDWPNRGKTPDGKCNGSDSIACSYQYGANKARADIKSVRPVHLTRVWIDVEPEYSWTKNRAKNAAAVEGMASVFKREGSTVGLYFQTTELNGIIGSITKNSPLYGSPEWLLGATSLNGRYSAEKNCHDISVTGGTVQLTQIAQPNQIDKDILCLETG